MYFILFYFILFYFIFFFENPTFSNRSRTRSDKMAGTAAATATRDVETELKRRVAYLPGGRDRSGQSLIVVPIDPPPAGLCGAVSSSSSHQTASNSSSSSSGNAHHHGRTQLNDSFDSDSRLMTRGEEERCQDLDRVLRYLLPIAL